MRAWICGFLLLVACEDTRRASDRDRDHDRPRAEKVEIVGPVGSAHARCAGPGCLPDVDFMTTDGYDYTRDEFEGKVVVLNFWASWSTASTRDIPLMSRISDRYDDVIVLGIAMNGSPTEIEDLRRGLGMTYRAVALSQLASAITAPDNLPTTWIYDRHGTRIEQNIGAYDEATLIDTIERARAVP